MMSTKTIGARKGSKRDLDPVVLVTSFVARDRGMYAMLVWPEFVEN